MNQVQAREYLLTKPESMEYFPFGPDVAVFKIEPGKMFATLAKGKDTEHFWMNLKCDPDQAQMLRDIFPSVFPGYHMNKLHWNTVVLDGSVPVGEIERMIDMSYTLILKSLTKKRQAELIHRFGAEQLGLV